MNKEQIYSHINWHHERYGYQKPIFEIIVFKNPDKELVGKNGKPLGFPDTGSLDRVGFYYELDTAIQAMHENWCDIQETCYFAGFVLCKFPGLYQCSVRDMRIFFLWDEEKKGFFEAEEPEIFKHVAY